MYMHIKNHYVCVTYPHKEIQGSTAEKTVTVLQYKEVDNYKKINHDSHLVLQNEVKSIPRYTLMIQLLDTSTFGTWFTPIVLK